MKKALVGLLVLGVSQASAGSKTGADFLKIPVGARATAVGQAFTALSEGAESLSWNPAGIAQSKMGSLSLSHQNLFGDNNLDVLGVSFPAGLAHQRWAWGLSALRLSYADQVRRGVDRAQNGSFGASDLSVGAVVAKQFGVVQLGTHVKWIRQELAGEKAGGMAVDVGFLSPTPLARLSLGASVRNIGPSLKFIREEYNLPLSVSVGTVYRVLPAFSISMDLQQRPYEKQTTLSFGAELLPSDTVFLRAGYLNKLSQAVANRQRSESERGDFRGLSGFTAGLGIRLGQVMLDYAMVPFGELGNTQSFTLSTSFGAESKRASVVPVDLESERTITIFSAPSSNQPWWSDLE